MKEDVEYNTFMDRGSIDFKMYIGEEKIYNDICDENNKVQSKPIENNITKTSIDNLEEDINMNKETIKESRSDIETERQDLI